MIRHQRFLILFSIFCIFSFLPSSYGLLSKDLILENIIRDFYSKKGEIDPELNKILKTTDLSEPFNIYTKSDNLDTFKNELSEISFFPKSNTSWVGYDFNFSIENLYLTGITKIRDSINGKISILNNIRASETKTDKIIPNSFLAFLTFSTRDPERFIFNFEDYLIRGFHLAIIQG